MTNLALFLPHWQCLETQETQFKVKQKKLHFTYNFPSIYLKRTPSCFQSEVKYKSIWGMLKLAEGELGTEHA